MASISCDYIQHTTQDTQRVNFEFKVNSSLLQKISMHIKIGKLNRYLKTFLFINFF